VVVRGTRVPGSGPGAGCDNALMALSCDCQIQGRRVLRIRSRHSTILGKVRYTNSTAQRMRSIRDRLEAALDRIEGGRSGKHVFLKLYPDAARAAADAADARRRADISIGPLDGALVSIKDNFDVAGETTTAGSKLLRDAPPAKADAPVIARLRRGGAVILGKTNMVEFAMGSIGFNPHLRHAGQRRRSVPHSRRLHLGRRGLRCRGHERHHNRLGHGVLGARPGGVQWRGRL
jgi:hypothetical protein